MTLFLVIVGVTGSRLAVYHPAEPVTRSDPRLTLHESRTQVTPTSSGIPWLRFVVFPEYRKVKARKVRHATPRLRARYEAYCAGEISFAEFDASVQGWINHVRHADSWGLRRYMLTPFRLNSTNLQRAKGGRV